MFTCQYCNATYAEFQTSCSSCGSLLEPVDEQTLSGKALEPQLEQIRKICQSYGRQFPHLFISTVSSSSVNMAEKSFAKFPLGEELFLFCDTTPMGSGIWGFILSESGIYWQNHDDAPSDETFLSWDDFAKRNLQLSRFALIFGQDAVLNFAGVRKYEDREKIFQLFRELKGCIEK